MKKRLFGSLYLLVVMLMITLMPVSVFAEEGLDEPKILDVDVKCGQVFEVTVPAGEKVWIPYTVEFTKPDWYIYESDIGGDHYVFEGLEKVPRDMVVDIFHSDMTSQVRYGGYDGGDHIYKNFDTFQDTLYSTHVTKGETIYFTLENPSQADVTIPLLLSYQDIEIENVDAAGTVIDVTFHGVGRLHEIKVNWNNRTVRNMTISEGITGLSDCAISCGDFGTIQSLTLPTTLEYLGRLSIANLLEVEEIIFPEGSADLVIGTDWYQDRVELFNGCTNLKKVVLPSIDSFKNDMFRDCENLETVIVKEVRDQSALPSGLFMDCTKLSTFEIPDTINAIGSNAFRNCESLTELEIPEGVTQIGDCAFMGCKSLTQVILPKSIQTLGSSIIEQTDMDFKLIYPGSISEFKALSIGQTNRSLYDKLVCLVLETPEFTGQTEYEAAYHADQAGYVTLDNCLTVDPDKKLHYTYTVEDSSVAEQYDGATFLIKGKGATDIIISVDEPKFYTQETCRVHLTVEKEAIAFDELPAFENMTYTGDYQPAVLKAGKVTGGKILYSLDKVAFSEALPQVKEVGSYTVYYQAVPDDTDHYVPSSVKRARFSVLAKQEPVTEDKEHKEHSYDKEVVMPATCNAPGKVVKVCECGAETVSETIPAIASVAFVKDSTVYTGKILATPTMVVKDEKGENIDAKYIDIIRPKTIQGVGIYSFKVEFTGKYSGSQTLTYRVLPKKAVVGSVKADKKKIKVTIKSKVAVMGGDSYTVAYRVKGTKKWKTVSTKASTITIKKLKKGKRYEVRVCASKKIGKEKLTGSWSSVKTSKAVK